MASNKLGVGAKYGGNPHVIAFTVQIPIKLHEEILSLIDQGIYLNRSELCRKALRDLVALEYMIEEKRKQKVKDFKIIGTENLIQVGEKVYKVKRRLE
ncbi:MAG: ribbon-helix-helix domain-containing protein [Candidatus Hodarchaeales archaeon]|jgi:Arc/MetJ-type ribon-helix-helix transcriptional regulator